MFGHLTEQVQDVRFANSYNPLPLEQRSPELAKVFKYIEGGAFGDGQTYEALLKTVSCAAFRCILVLTWHRCMITITTL
jgi:starch phosphorylase